MLDCEHLGKRFGESEVLRDVSFHMQKGEVLAIIGRSGSGKSTLLRCLNHLETPDAGRVTIDGDVMLDMSAGGYAPNDKLRKLCLKMGYVFQQFNLFPHFNVLRNLTQAQVSVLKRDRKTADAYARKLLQKVGLSDKENAYPCELSGGQQQRVAIARALALDPEILCFDEPTSALDPMLTHEVLNVIRSLAEEKRTMIVVTHEMAFAREVADRVIYMADGVVVADGKPNEVFKNESVLAFSMGG